MRSLVSPSGGVYGVDTSLSEVNGGPQLRNYNGLPPGNNNNKYAACRQLYVFLFTVCPSVKCFWAGLLSPALSLVNTEPKLFFFVSHITLTV